MDMLQVVRCAAGNVRRISSLESLFCYDKSIPEEIIEKPVGLALAEKNVGENPRCSSCQAKGAILCATCSGSGLYVDSILESQGIIVKVRCLGNVLSEFLDIVYLTLSLYLILVSTIIYLSSYAAHVMRFFKIEKTIARHIHYIHLLNHK